MWFYYINVTVNIYLHILLHPQRDIATGIPLICAYNHDVGFKFYCKFVLFFIIQNFL